jgi:hypothetical protein
MGSFCFGINGNMVDPFSDDLPTLTEGDKVEIMVLAFECCLSLSRIWSQSFHVATFTYTPGMTFLDVCLKIASKEGSFHTNSNLLEKAKFDLEMDPFNED